ncbi:mannitol-1-phosphate 5-dehydrogenase [Salipaludibacillus keqinensis]|uniref:Mannitol-1-phosphate 5-dehydrogenase n=1 Tax=Salipaludibacillus keqinensis TaxID=2045207 RepID=A0A323T8A1_9BACI|nr:mannitol-1-phosphate 5-dehydrogenase [Salipaludibacillus keqinensis]PYZ91921.1 mannitol-1-phosphate 5-dehydrogenase [Salipaludibacillus keqinensis]
MIAVHFGAGNIGRGFIGKILAESDYEMTFVDVNAEIIDGINEHKMYQVFYAEEDRRSFTVSNIRGLHSQHQEEEVVQAIAQADLLTTAVGAHILPHIAPLIAKGLKKRLVENNHPLNVIACENAIGGTDQLKQAVLKHLDPVEVNDLNRLIGFPNAAVDRIVPNQNQENILDVLVEPFFEWVVDKRAVKGTIPPVEDIHFVEDLDAFIERKLFTVNTGHALAAYSGYQAGKPTVQESLLDPVIKEKVLQGLKETGQLLCEKHGFDPIQHQGYIEKILERFTNPYLTDEVTRVARQPIKKLGLNERLISPVKQLMTRKIVPYGLLTGIVAALQYDFSEDAEAVELQKKIKQHGVKVALSEVSGLAEDDEIIDQVFALYSETV